MTQPYRSRVPRPTLSPILSALLVSALLFGGCGGEGGNGGGRSTERLIPAVEAVQARYGNLPLTERLSGLVKATNQVELYPEISARIQRVYVENGRQVKAGDPLVELRDNELREQLKQAEATLQIARAQAKQAEAEWQRLKSELERGRSLFDNNLISPTEWEIIQTDATSAEADVELARARVEQAQATVDERKEALSRTIIRAPVDGAVGNRNAEVGMLVTPNTRLFTLGKLDSVKIEIVLTDRQLGYINEGQRSEIISQNLPSGAMTAPVARISPFLHPVSHSTTAEIDMANSERVLKPGMFVTVDVYYGESDQATLVPLASLWENPTTGGTGVFIARDSLKGEAVTMLESGGSNSGALTEPTIFDFVPVEVVAKGKMNVGIRGIDPGDWVVTIGQDLLGADTGQARVRPVKWEWVEELQELQREDLLQEIIEKQQAGSLDTAMIGLRPENADGV